MNGLPQSRSTAWLHVALILLLTAGISLAGIGNTPAYLGGDEAHFGVQARSIASTGRDLSGHVMPLFFNLTDPAGDPTSDARSRWYQPTLFYLMAVVLRFLPFTEASVRVPTALIAILNVALIYGVARRLLPSAYYPSLCALMLALTPAHVILTRQATDYVCSLPFVLGWLWCVLVSLEIDSAWLAFGAGLLLGVGVYSYLAAWIVMPAYLILTWVAQFRSGRRPMRLSASTALGFALPVLPLVPWLWLHPQMVSATLGRYGMTQHKTLLEAAAGMFRFGVVQDKVSIYWDYFNPAFLFLSGGASLTTGTSRVGVFLVSVAVFLAVGIYEVLTRPRATPIGVLLLGGLAIAPLGATLAGERYMIQREFFVLPFVVLLSAFGLASLLRSPRSIVRSVAIMLLAVMPLQFAVFYRDYFTSYRLRAAMFFDLNDFRDVAEQLMAADRSSIVPRFYLSRVLDEASVRWRFYLTKGNRLDLLQRTSYFDGDGLDQGGAPAGSLLALQADEHRLADLMATGKWAVERTIRNVSDDVSSVILRKVQD